VGKYGLRGVLWEGICDGGSRDGGRIIAGYYGELLFFQTTGEQLPDLGNPDDQQSGKYNSKDTS